MSTKKQETHNRLLDSAANLFRSQGVSVRLEDVAKEAGVSRQSVYLHFSSRSGLLVELFDHVDRLLDVESTAEAINNASDARSALELVVRKRSAYISEIHPFAGPLIAARNDDSAVEAAYEDRQAARRRDYLLLIQRMKSEDILADEWGTESAVEVMRAILSIPTWELLSVERSWSSEKYEANIQRVLERALLK